MSRDNFSSSSSWFSGGKIFVALVVVLVVIATIVVRSHVTSPDDIAAMLDRDPTSRLTLAALKTNYPGQHETALARFTRAFEEGGERQVADEASIFMHDFMRDKTDALLHAPEADLRELARSAAALVRAMRHSDVALCGRFMAGNVAAGVTLPREVLIQADAVSAQQILTAKHGEPLRLTPLRAPTRPDIALWLQTIERTDSTTARLMAQGQVDRGTAAEQCNAGIVAYESAAALPSPQAGRILTELLRRQMRPGA
jgi:hypothetical protein